jgi:hypothetical protein
MRNLRFIIAAIIVLLALPVLISCTPISPEAAGDAATPEPESAVESSEDEFSRLEDLTSAQFDNPTEIDNQWLPMTPGTRYVYEGTTVEDDGTVVPHRIEINVTDLTKMIAGIRTHVSWDLDYSDGELVEAELAFFAQDNDGNVWHLGQYPEEYEEGNFIAAPTWLHGFASANAGIMMLADPQLGTPSYSEGWGPEVDWTDRGKVDQMGEETCVATGCYQDVMVIAETARSEPGAEQLKYYARGVGNVRVGWRGEGEKTKEVLELVAIEQLDADTMMQVRADALAMEARAYKNSPDVYGQTTPIELPLGVEAPQPVAAEASAPEAPQSSGPAGVGAEIVVYASDLPQSALFDEFEFRDDPTSPGGKFIGLPNYGDELDPPPENDPNVTFTVQVEEGLDYRCWVHMKVGEPLDRSTANKVWVQFTEAEDQNENPILEIGTDSYLTAQGPEQQGWAWVGCNLEGATPEESLVSFGTSGAVTVRIQAGMEGVGFDQFVLSSAVYQTQAPAPAVVEK